MDYCMNTAQMRKVRLLIGEKYICIITPLLGSRNSSHLDRKYGESVWALLSAHMDELPEITDKAIIVVTVYGTDYKETYKVDPDNVDSKNVIDRISDFYAGDGGKNTIYISIQCTTDNMEAGTYILCVPAEKVMVNKAQIMDLIKNINN